MTNDPRVSKFQEKIGQFINFVSSYFINEIKNYKRNGNTEEAGFLDLYNQSWVRWSIELFCDLFATYTIGPAYAWANLHLCVKRGFNPFYTPLIEPNSHPADDARMKSILYGLDIIGFNEISKPIVVYWNKYIEFYKLKENANFKMAFPNHLLEHCSNLALEATKSINCNIVNPNTKSAIYNLLNSAWTKFISDPQEYLDWERIQRENII